MRVYILAMKYQDQIFFSIGNIGKGNVTILIKFSQTMFMNALIYGYTTYFSAHHASFVRSYSLLVKPLKLSATMFMGEIYRLPK